MMFSDSLLYFFKSPLMCGKYSRTFQPSEMSQQHCRRVMWGNFSRKVLISWSVRRNCYDDGKTYLGLSVYLSIAPTVVFKNMWEHAIKRFVARLIKGLHLSTSHEKDYTCWCVTVCRRTMPLTLKAGLAPSSRRHLTADVHRLDAAMCRAVPKSKSLQVASTSTKKWGETGIIHLEMLSSIILLQLPLRPCSDLVTTSLSRDPITGGQRNTGLSPHI